MTHTLPPEIIDLVVDHLCSEQASLRSCCVVSKSWVPRSRGHLFARVEFNTFGPSIESWMKAFPDPLNSPAHHTRSLAVIGLRPIIATGNDVVRWIRAFHSVVHLQVKTLGWGDRVQGTLLPFHGLSSALRSLHLESPNARSSGILDLMCSFPLLEDLAVDVLRSEGEPDDWITPSTLPRLNGSLALSGMIKGIGPIMRRLLDLPDGLRFIKIALVWVKEADLKLTTDLISRCSDTLESLDVTEDLLEPVMTLFDLSTATKLKHLVFQCNQPNVQWITMALQTVDSEDLRQITLRPDSYTFRYTIEETVYREWEDLDRLLVQFGTSRSTRPKIVFEMELDERDLIQYALRLLPELAERGLVDTVEYLGPQ